MITVQPVIELDGAELSCNPDSLGILPIGVDDMVIEWGREGYFDGGSPARMTLVLWDSTSEWAVRIRDSRALGTHVRVRWAIGSETITMFRGTVADAEATRLDRLDSRGRHVYAITLTVVDPTAALGNVRPLHGVLSDADTMEVRKQWLMGLCEYGGLKVSDIDYQSGYAPSRCSPLEVGEDSALDLIEQFYASQSGDAWTYDPESNKIRQCERHDWAFTTYLVSQSDTPGAVLISTSDTVIDYVTRDGVALAACDVTVPDGFTITASTDTDINAVETTWRDPLDEWKEKKSFRDGVTLGSPRRLLANETWMTADWAIEMQLGSAWDRARNEGRRPKHPPIQFRPGHQFATARLARWWLRTWEDTRPAFINGDAAHAWLTSGADVWAPLVSPLGGTVRYNGRTGWDITLHVQWMHNRTTVAPMTWANLQQMRFTTSTPSSPWWHSLVGLPAPKPVTVGSPAPERDVRWGEPDTDSLQYRFDRSVTWADLRFLDNDSREIKDVLK